MIGGIIALLRALTIEQFIVSSRCIQPLDSTFASSLSIPFRRGLRPNAGVIRLFLLVTVVICAGVDSSSPVVVPDGSPVRLFPMNLDTGTSVNGMSKQQHLERIWNTSDLEWAIG